MMENSVQYAGHTPYAIHDSASYLAAALGVSVLLHGTFDEGHDLLRGVYVEQSVAS